MARISDNRIIRKLAGKVSTQAGRLFMPPICVHCEGERWKGTPLCLTCHRRLAPIRSPVCETCGIPACGSPHDDWNYPFHSTRFLFRMGRELGALIHGFKYRHYRRHIHVLCAQIRYRPDLIAYMNGYDALVPVPLHASRLRERGYNQAEALGAVLAETTGTPLLSTALRRIRGTGTQTRLGKGGRQANLEGAFACPRPESVKGLRILLIDDVFTTGATASECARTLLKAGCSETALLALARVEANPVQDDFRLEMELAAGYCL